MSKKSDEPRFPRNAVLVATDLSEASSVALKEADSWARRLDAPLVVVHAIPHAHGIFPLQPHLYDPAPGGELRERAANAVADQIERTLDRAVDDCLIALEEGTPHAVVVRLAKAHAPRLVVVGTGDKGIVARLMLGSTSEQVVRHAPGPVLVARAKRGKGPVVVATDLSEAAFPGIQVAADEARRRECELVVVHAIQLTPPVIAALDPTFAVDESTSASMQEAAERLIASACERVGYAGRAMVVVGEPVKAVAQVVDELDASLCVVASHGHTGLEHFAVGSVAEGIVRTTNRTALLVRQVGDA